MDSIGDFLTRIRNAVQANHRLLEVPSSKMKLEITRVLKEKGFIHDFLVEGEQVKPTLKIALKYSSFNKRAAISGIVRVSKPGLRKYVGVEKMPRVMNGLGVAIVSTPKGIMTDKEAKSQNVGGEVICVVY